MEAAYHISIENIELLNRHNIMNALEWEEYKNNIINFLNQTQ